MSEFDRYAIGDGPRCQVPPAGWVCSREAGHGGPCAARRDHFLGGAFYASDRLTWRQRLTRWLFPAALAPDFPEPFMVGAVVSVECVLSWRDRLRVLVSGRLMVKSRVGCQHEPGWTLARSVCFPLPPGRAPHDGLGC